MTDYMLLQEVKKDYSLNQFGTILNPGKFEGETLATPYFYMVDDGVDVIEISDDERFEFGIEDKYTHVCVIESNDGFVSLFWAESLAEAEKESNNQYIMDSIEFEDENSDIYHIDS